MTYTEWRKIYIDKTETFEQWERERNKNVVPSGIVPGGKLPFKRQEHLSTSDENVLATNPNYLLGKAFQQNCQKCVPTYEMRMRGYDVVARPTFDIKTDLFATDYWDKVFKKAVFEEGFKGSGKEDIIKRMKKMGDGARAEVYVIWDFGDVSHVFVAENRNGNILFLDPQTGALNVEHYFENVKHGMTKFLRIDNLEPDENYIKWFCKENK